MPPLPKICHTYPTMMKLDTVILYLRKIQKIYKSREHPLSSALLTSGFFRWKSTNFATSRSTDVDWILTHNF